MNARMEPPIEALPGVGLRRRGQRKLVLWGGVILLGGFAAFVLWAVLAPLDAGVALEGTVTVDGYRKRIQHPAGGVVAEVPVTEGESVSQGQTLLKLDARVARA
ncbi:MAG: biotin/lipoyl-binding protein, partial [Alloalcanivorax xenomutans]